MHLVSYAFGATLALLLALSPTVGAAQAPAAATPPANGATAAAARGVRCPADYETIFDAPTRTLRCRRDVVSWVVTSCPEKDFGTYVAKAGSDSCGPTQIPGVGTPPGAAGSRPVACAAAGYTVVTDRTGMRDRCERVDRSFALPAPAA